MRTLLEHLDQNALRGVLMRAPATPIRPLRGLGQRPRASLARPGIAALTLVALACSNLLPACEAPETGTFVIEATVVGQSVEGRWVVVDVGTTPFYRPHEDAGRRFLWRVGDPPLRVTLECDPWEAGYSLNAHGVGVYAERPAKLGRIGDPAPEGSLPVFFSGQSAGTQCKHGQVISQRFTLVAEQRGYVDVAVNADIGEAGDAVWDVALSVPGHEELSWAAQVASSVYGDHAGSVSYVGACGQGEVGTEGAGYLSVSLAQLYAGEAPKPPEPEPEKDDVDEGPIIRINVGVLNLGQDPVLELWRPPVLRRRVSCPIAQDVFVALETTVAVVRREVLGTRASFAGVSCAASWECGDAPSLALSCSQSPVRRYRDRNAEALLVLLDDLTLTCAGEAPTRIDPEVDGVVTEQLVEGRPLVTWRVTPPLEGATGACRLRGRATSRLVHAEASRVFADDGGINAGAVYPVVTWDLPATDEDGVCAPAHIDTTGPIGVTYTQPDAGDATRFAHAWRTALVEEEAR